MLRISKKLITHQLLLFIVLIICFIFLQRYSAIQTVAQFTQSQLRLLSYQLEDASTSTPEIFINHLQQFQEIDAIYLKNKDSTSQELHQKEHNLTFSRKIFTSLISLPQPEKLYQWPNKQQISIQLNYDNIINSTINSIYFTFIIFLSSFLLSTFLIHRSNQYVATKVARTLADIINSYITSEKHAKPTPWHRLPKEFSIVITPLKHLSKFVAQQLQEMKFSTEAIKNEAFKDSLTGLPNKNRFVQYYEEHIHNQTEDEFGVLAVIRGTELQDINHMRGYQEGDNYILAISQVIKEAAYDYKSPGIYRLKSSDFCIILSHIELKQAQQFAEALKQQFTAYQQAHELTTVAFTGLVEYRGGQALGELLAMADTALSLAQTKQPNAWQIQQSFDQLSDEVITYGDQNWRLAIDDVLNTQQFELVKQIVIDQQQQPLYYEVMARFISNTGEVFPTASFVAMAEKLNKIIALDRMIVTKVINTLKIDSISQDCYAINLNFRTIQDENFLSWLENKLLKHQQVGRRLIFEISEFGLQQNIRLAIQFLQLIHQYKVRLTVEKFGVGFTSFQFFKELRPDFIKMDGIYTRQIHEDRNNEYFLKLLVESAQGLEIQVLAESVETKEEKEILQSLQVNGLQGYFIGKPVTF